MAFFFLLTPINVYNRQGRGRGRVSNRDVIAIQFSEPVMMNRRLSLVMQRATSLQQNGTENYTRVTSCQQLYHFISVDLFDRCCRLLWSFYRLLWDAHLSTAEFRFVKNHNRLFTPFYCVPTIGCVYRPKNKKEREKKNEICVSISTNGKKCVYNE